MSPVDRPAIPPRRPRRQLPLSRALATAALCTGLLHACSGSGSSDSPAPLERNPDLSVYRDPGIGEWETVARDRLIVGHRGLDLVIVARNAGQLAFIHDPWILVRRALIAHDPMYAGNEEAFCAAYEAGDYAPDIITVDK